MAYVQHALTQLVDNDGLLVLGEGLGLPRLLSACFRLHNAAGGGLVLLLGCSEWQKRAVQLDLSTDGSPLADVTADVSLADRLALYGAGGCLFVTTRILVVDLLTQRLLPGSISGLLICNAHRVTDTCGEAFTVRLLRGGGNDSAFVRAFSDRPGDLARGFSTAQRVLRALLLRHLYLWPRFHLAVRQVLEERPPQVVELRLPLPRPVRLIQEALLEVMEACLGELRRSRHVDTSQLTLEDGLFRSFDRVLSRQLEPVWHTAPRRLRQAVADLRTLRNLAQSLLRLDAVSFLRLLESLRAAESRDSLWLFADATYTVFEQAKRRVFTIRRPAAAPPAAADAVPPVAAEPVLDPVLEAPSKWALLAETIEEIRREQAALLAEADAAEEPRSSVLRAASRAPVLVMARDLASARQLEAVLLSGADGVMQKLWQDYLLARAHANRPPAPRRKAAGKAARPSKKARSLAPPVAGAPLAAGTASKAEEAALAQEAAAQARAGKAAKRGNASKAAAAASAQEAELAALSACLPSVVNGVAIASLETREGALEQFEPTFVVMLEPDQAFIREVEVYKSDRPGLPCRLYMLLYDTSIDEQRYLVAVKREQEAFDSLISTRGHMAAPDEQDGRAIAAAVRGGACPPALAGATPQGATVAVSVRKAGGRSVEAPRSRVVVDTREFMSHLPCVLHCAGFALAPVTLDVGDYVLSPELCVERKSVPDLVGSLASGRLYTQAEAMCRHYATPALLIEFDADKQFGLTSVGDLGNDVSSRALGSKLALLLLHFPKLRVIWSRSVHATAAIFAALKANAEQPDEATAAAVGVQAEERESEHLVNTAALDLLRRLPGVNERSAKTLLRRFGLLAALAASSEAEIAEAMNDKGAATRLHTFLHAPFPSCAGIG